MSAPGRDRHTGIARVPLQALRFHPRNIRSNLGDLDELAASIKAEGVLVPLMAQRTPGGGLQLLHGHRRWAAADIAGLHTVPVTIVDRPLRDDEAILGTHRYADRAADRGLRPDGAPTPTVSADRVVTAPTCPSGKARHATRRQARQVVRDHNAAGTGKPMRSIYHCGACGGWHTSSWSRRQWLMWPGRAWRAGDRRRSA